MLKILDKKSNIKIFLIGIAFKGYPETSDIENQLQYGSYLSLNQKNIYAFDYNVTKNTIEKLGVKFAKLNQGFKNADAVVFLNNNKRYEQLNINKLANLMKPAVFLTLGIYLILKK